ncbi:MAG TPA: DUF1579 domain-containing protein [Flavobacterium sp.]|jgi:hypothetical protein
MKKVYLSLFVMALMAVACKNVEDKAIDTKTTDSTGVAKEEPAAAPMDSAAMMKAWENYATPGDMHKMFASEVGTWDEESIMWMGPDDQNPTKSKMTAVNTMILGGRYQHSKHSGTIMGMPFEGISTMGYDNASKKIVGTWVDNMGTGIMYLTGDYNPSSKTIELKGNATDPTTGKQKPYRELYTIVDSDTRKMVMYDVTPDGKEYKSMEMNLKRRK